MTRSSAPFPPSPCRATWTLQAILNYVPQRADMGVVNLHAVAYRGPVVSEPDEITVVVRESHSQVIATPVQQSNVPFIPNDGVCRALVNVNGLNFRTGPSTGFQIITVLGSGTLAPITGRNSAHSWWRLMLTIASAGSAAISLRNTAIAAGRRWSPVEGSNHRM